jgi:hypothetical protein
MEWSNASSRDERAPARLFGEAKPIKATSRVEKRPERGALSGCYLLIPRRPRVTKPRGRTEWRDTCIGEEGHHVPAIIEETLDRSRGVVVGDQPASRHGYLQLRGDLDEVNRRMRRLEATKADADDLIRWRTRMRDCMDELADQGDAVDDLKRFCVTAQPSP